MTIRLGRFKGKIRSAMDSVTPDAVTEVWQKFECGMYGCELPNGGLH
jgi:hypothetical protein